LGVAFRQAWQLGNRLAVGDLARYERLHRESLKMPQGMARILLLMDRFPTLRDRAIAMLAGQPELFRRLLGVHVGAEPLGRFVAARGWDVAWRMAFPPDVSVPSILS